MPSPRLRKLHLRLSARRRATTTRYELTSPEGSFTAEVVAAGDGFRVTVDAITYQLRLKRGAGQNSFVAEVSDKPVSLTLLEASSQRVELILNGERLSFQRPAATTRQPLPAPPPASVQRDLITSPMPGKVIGALVKAGERVKAGDPLVILESMKMEIAVRSDRDAEVEEVLVKEGVSVKRGQGLVRLSG